MNFSLLKEEFKQHDQVALIDDRSIKLLSTRQEDFELKDYTKELLKCLNDSGAIQKNQQSFSIYVDDETHSIEAVSKVFKEMNLDKRLMTFQGGQEVIQYFKDLLTALEIEDSDSEDGSIS